MQIDVYADPAELAREAAERIGAWLRAEGHLTLGLAGGSTPRLTYELLRSEDVPWHRTHVWLTDERHVSLDHPESNGGMALESLLDHVPARFHPVEHRQDPAVTASGYEHTLHKMWRDVDGARGSGLVLLGIGDDGHTASLFPDTTALAESEHDYVANWVDEKSTWRLTATLPLLARADRLIFLVAGAAKAAVVEQILEGGSTHPAAIVSNAAKEPIWMLDRAAAALLS